MRGRPETASAIASRIEMTPETLSPILEKMSKKGLIFRSSKGAHRRYHLVPLAEGMWEFHLNSIDLNDLHNLHEYFDTFFQKGWYATPTTQHRIIPVAQSLPSDLEILPYEQAESIIQGHERIAVARCICRKEMQMLGKGCDHPSEVCLIFDSGADFYVENGLAREITQDEALQILKTAMDSGLVLQPGNGQKIWCICMCCSCCCMILRALQKMERPAEVVHSNFYAQIENAKCISCGLCEEKCPMNAIRTGSDFPEVNRNRCIGCGVCVGNCSESVIQLRQKDEQNRYVPPENAIEMTMRVLQERESQKTKV
jgi:Pyruvate/2-oxoacid:ferredoxin oxidoreductase delta subunit